KLYKSYKSPIYVFYLPPVFKVENRKHYQVFQCAAKQCVTLGGHVIKRNMDTADAMSISNLKAHVKKCFGGEVVAATSGVRNLIAAQDVMKDKVMLKCSSLIAVTFEKAGQQKVTYSTKPTTPIEVCTNHTGWPQQYIPSPTRVSQDVWEVFLLGWKLIATVLQMHKGRLHFGTDCWTSLN
ncbi:hypothetical protein BJV74DRAFT_755985, partial [Russula compacta]